MVSREGIYFAMNNFMMVIIFFMSVCGLEETMTQTLWFININKKLLYLSSAVHG